jgi:hypothetical protein
VGFFDYLVGCRRIKAYMTLAHEANHCTASKTLFVLRDWRDSLRILRRGACPDVWSGQICQANGTVPRQLPQCSMLRNVSSNIRMISLGRQLSLLECCTPVCFLGREFLK